MAVLTTEQLKVMRQECARNYEVDWSKSDINDALQAIEDWFEANRASLAGAIDAGTTHNFSNPEKRRLVKYWLFQKFKVE